MGVHKMEQGRDVAEYEEPRMHARPAMVRMHAGERCNHLGIDVSVRNQPVVVRACVPDVLHPLCVRMARKAVLLRN